jgi:uncharacterized SAM-binding protein YcdF (DUF218 family)
MKQLILHLGGRLGRADKCIELAEQFKDSVILVSSEGGNVLDYYTDRGIDSSRVFHDTAAWDTVTNFTKTYKRIKEEFKVDEVYVVTDDFHMRRSMIIAQAVYWERGITAIPCSAGNSISTIESDDLVISDAIRAWVWRLTGLLFYWKSVRKERTGTESPIKWNEIGI